MEDDPGEREGLLVKPNAMPHRCRATALFHYLRAAAVILAMPVFGTQPEPAPSLGDHRVLAAMTVQLARFVEWPSDTWSSNSNEFHICTTSDDRVAAALIETPRGEQISGRAVRVRPATRVQELAGCQIVMLGPASDKRFLNVPGPTLTVATHRGFVSSGGMVELFVEGGKVAFELNVKAAEQTRLRFSARLQSIARNNRKTQ